MLWLVAGATLHMVADTIRTDAQALVAFCATKGITVLESTPSYISALLQSGLLDTPRSAPLVLVLGGEGVPAGLWQELCDNDQVAAYNFYGPTEFTVDSVLTRIRGTVAHIGRAVRNVESYVLDDFLTPVPHGVTGELYLAGAGMATGYVNRPAETANRFIANPYSDGARMYRTGDLVRRLPGGELQFVARADDQLKIRGFRVEPGEVEGVLARHDHVERAAVVVESGATGRIIGYYVGIADPAELRVCCRAPPRVHDAQGFCPLGGDPTDPARKVGQTRTAGPGHRQHRLQSPHHSPGGKDVRRLRDGAGRQRCGDGRRLL